MERFFLVVVIQKGMFIVDTNLTLCRRQLGLGSSVFGIVPCKISIDQKIRDIACGGQHTIFISDEDCVFACGWGGKRQLGLGDQEDVALPTEVTILSGKKVKQVTCGYYDTYYILGRVYYHDCFPY